MFFFKQKTAYELRISDWSSDVCSSDLSPSNRGIGALRSDIGFDSLAQGRNVSGLCRVRGGQRQQRQTQTNTQSHLGKNRLDRDRVGLTGKETVQRREPRIQTGG